ncbi:hypothetical protein ACRC6Q_12185 [Planococcus sp. SE5232]|uniref:hypothetical protein n=1 Tax=unclassified Planococcus (in: firmicutes) TaxID=2662419 RepID=UPI001CBE9DAD|nr:hypothetical protein [Planococcus sp. 4-30]
MTRKGTAGRSPGEQASGAPDSGIDKAVKKTKEAFDKDNEATDYEDGKDEMQDAKEYSKDVSDKRTGDARRND